MKSEEFASAFHFFYLFHISTLLPFYLFTLLFFYLFTFYFRCSVWPILFFFVSR